MCMQPAADLSFQSEAVQMSVGAEVDPSVDQRRGVVVVFFEIRLADFFPFRMGGDNRQAAVFVQQIEFAIAVYW